VVERDNIVVDGAGYTLQGTGGGEGIDLRWRRNVTIRNMEIKAFGTGVWLFRSLNNSISNNNMTNNMDGIELYWSSNNSISDNNIRANERAGIRLWYYSNYNSVLGNNIANDEYGIEVSESLNNTISGNNITANKRDGVWLYWSSNSSILGNNITANNRDGIGLYWSSNYNSVSRNNIVANNRHGIGLYDSLNNKFCHNNFIDNFLQLYIYTSGYANVWDDGYPSGGNYWSNYTGVDMNSGFYQNETDSDGIGDIPHTIDANNIDNCPLIAPISFFDAGTWNDTTYYVNFVSNSTLSHFHFSPDEGAFVSLWVKGETVTEAFGFCRVAIPKDLLWVEDGWTVLYGSYPLSYKAFSDENCTYLYFTYTNPPSNGFTTVTINGTHVIPEFPSFLILPLIMPITLLAVIVYRKKHAKISGTP
jgi:parallel beta-helix repeat protein